ncbi:protein phosphatase 1 regulatory inhibitor subunit PPP1R8 homolog [Beta vulgaris subsp. vulgaris]|uniref:protein phosphatase 1 regulatory inhibitor subunit PPP1R8 homolog n=1 Tax=Beta vulgaris subsp. vulgaris TaxID=3555 RepID=UPI002036B778|nr:protein phosphatase 1 regulatory inhibitor subunit PPP1R8 homolog [Beta vulgaris subsp. vulgaris]XP_010686596.2 protein phosphatase 1 regulatory inhibitor subunit PPP1R8 homolog [Beta vulgaris subsp. vulgaris]XP_010686597.2 protein phosphatase 1 regulatory inhibitor subunit PPP1R8 homolog [Beta vulgaris subsp. vulgaris]XP_019106685.2 protein phosphatase 1 regulatory inhibitor subunit PPP1R8 homolog [Beta vulgaris subsp. vulgaris]XP_048491133.1 protein phosphatase 1 regulatory inhibitor subun
MYGRAGLNRFQKAQTLEPFSVAPKTSSLPSAKAVTHSYPQHPTQDGQVQSQPPLLEKPASNAAASESASMMAPHVTQVGGGQSTWQPPDWAIEPRTSVYYLEVMKDGEVLDRINLDKKRHIFGRQFHTCDFVLDHQSVSRQHAAVVPHKNGSIYVMDLGSAHGTFVANERLTKDTPVELEAGQSLRFAASTRIYILRKNEAALFPSTPIPTEIDLPPAPDPSDEEAVVAYNTLLNRYGISKLDLIRSTNVSGLSHSKDDSEPPARAAKRLKKTRVAFRDQVGGELVEVVGVSDGADVETEPGPLGLKEGSLVGKYESLVQITVIPKGKGQMSVKEDNVSPKGVTNKLQEVLNKVKRPNTSKGGIYDDLYGDSFSGKVGSSWATSSCSSVGREPSPSNMNGVEAVVLSNATSGTNRSLETDDDDDLFGD